LAPYLFLDASTDTVEDNFAITVGRSDNLFGWYMAGTTFVLEWDDPTIPRVYNGDTNFRNSSHVIEVDTANEWVYFVIEIANSVPRPIIYTTMTSTFSPRTQALLITIR
jgi:hypothetical protein